MKKMPDMSQMIQRKYGRNLRLS